jgi:hypothetical protein
MIFSSFVGIVIVRCVQETFCMQCDSAGFCPFERYLKYCRGAVDRILLLTSRMPLGNARFGIRLADSIATCKQFRQNCSVFRIVVIKGRRFIWHTWKPYQTPSLPYFEHRTYHTTNPTIKKSTRQPLNRRRNPKALITLIVLPCQPCPLAEGYVGIASGSILLYAGDSRITESFNLGKKLMYGYLLKDMLWTLSACPRWRFTSGFV